MSAICSAALVTAFLLTGPTLASRLEEQWESTLGRDHPLAGQIWDVRGGRYVDTATLIGRLTQSRFVLLGEKHDNPDHHRLQARLLSALIAAGRRPAVGFEMFPTDTQAAIDRHLDTMPTDAAGLADVVNWKQTGWPAWSLYQPIAQVALDARLPIVATNLSSTTMQVLRRGGLGGVDSDLVARLGLDQPLTTDTRELMAAEIRDSHCGYASDAMVESMIAVQRARDAQMADRLVAREGGAVLIAGIGHVRTDWGVPVYLATRMPESQVTSVAFLEVGSGETEPAAYAPAFGGGSLPFDYIWFTPRVDDLDPCEKFSPQLKKLKEKRHIEAGTDDGGSSE